MHVQTLIPAHPIRRPHLANPARTMAYCLAEARPQVLVIFGLRFAVGAALGWRAYDGNLPRTCASAVIWELAVFFVYLYNGVADVSEDRINGSGRPIARGILDPATALVIALGAALAAIIGALAVGGAIVWLVSILLGLGFAYSGPPFYLKRHPASTAAVGMTGGLLSYAAGLTSQAASTPHTSASLVVFAAGASLWMGLTGTLAKDLPDVDGDTAAGRNSSTAILGERRARVILSCSALTIAIAFNVSSLAMSPALSVCAAPMLVGAIALAATASSTRSSGSRGDRRRPYRIFMLTQYATHLGAILLALVGA